MLASIFHTIVNVISGMTTGFWFMIFIGAMAFLALMPPAEPHAPAPKPEAAPKPDEGAPKEDNEAKWRKMLAFNEAKWRRIMYMMHLQRPPIQQQAPIQINIVTPDGMIEAKQAQARLSNQTIENSDGGVTNNAIPRNAPPPKQRPRMGMKRFAIPRPKLSIPRPRIAAKSTTDDMY